MAVTCALLPAGAGAADHLGMTMHPSTMPDAMNRLAKNPPDPASADTATLIQWKRQAGSTPAYTVPAGGGVITSWSYTSPSLGWPEKMALKILRPAGGTQFRVIGESAEATPLGDLIGPVPNTFPTRIPVQAGDDLGMHIRHIGNTVWCQEAAPPDNLGDKTRERVLTQNPPVGTTLDFAVGPVVTEQAARLDLAAVLEPDVDGDGLGDETQDDSVAGVDADTDPPETTLSGKKKVTTKRKSAKAKFTFESDEAGSTFMCRLDAKPFTKCTSPTKVKAKLGTHVFAVEAIDAAGNVDPTGAAKQFKVVKKKTRK